MFCELNNLKEGFLPKSEQMPHKNTLPDGTETWPCSNDNNFNGRSTFTDLSAFSSDIIISANTQQTGDLVVFMIEARRTLLTGFGYN